MGGSEAQRDLTEETRHYVRHFTMTRAQSPRQIMVSCHYEHKQC